VENVSVPTEDSNDSEDDTLNDLEYTSGNILKTVEFSPLQT